MKVEFLKFELKLCPLFEEGYKISSSAESKITKDSKDNSFKKWY